MQATSAQGQLAAQIQLLVLAQVLTVGLLLLLLLLQSQLMAGWAVAVAVALSLPAVGLTGLLAVSLSRQPVVRHAGHAVLHLMAAFVQHEVAWCCSRIVQALQALKLLC